jgi:RNA polymerase-binding transcription factor DksA
MHADKESAMAHSRERQRTDTMRMPDPDRAPRDRTERAAASRRHEAGSAAAARERLEREREGAIRRLRALGSASDGEHAAPRAGAGIVLDEGDEAQASERQDLGLVTRERVAHRINRLTAALTRIAEGTWGICRVCEERIRPARLAAIPEADTCRDCQERIEREGAAA